MPFILFIISLDKILELSLLGLVSCENKNNRKIKNQKILRENCVRAVMTIIFAQRKRKIWLRFMNAKKVICNHLLMRLKSRQQKINVENNVEDKDEDKCFEDHENH